MRKYIFLVLLVFTTLFASCGQDSIGIVLQGVNIDDAKAIQIFIYSKGSISCANRSEAGDEKHSSFLENAGKENLLFSEGEDGGDSRDFKFDGISPKEKVIIVRVLGVVNNEKKEIAIGCAEGSLVSGQMTPVKVTLEDP